MMERRHVLGFSLVYLVLFVVSEVKGTLTPSGPLFLDCGSQQTFSCSVTGAAAGWNITGLNGINAGSVSGMVAANTNPRIINTDTGDFLTSNITITGFTEADNGVVQCIELVSGAVQGMTAVSAGPPSCPTMTTPTRSTDFTTATVVWTQPASPPFTSTAVTFCPTSSLNCGNSVNCSSPCNISGLNPCLNYSINVTPFNNCGSATGCTMNTLDILSKGTPKCGSVVDLQTKTGENCPAFSWDPDGSLATMLMIIYTSSSDGSQNMTCDIPLQKCTIGNIQPNTFISILPGNNCGFTTGCQGHTVEIQLNDGSVVGMPNSTCVSILPVGAVVGGVVGGFLLVVIIIIIIVVIVVVCYCYPPARSACCCCVSGGSKRSTSTEPMKPRPGEDYADPQKVRENKESGKQGITYAALEFSEQAGSTGGQNVRSKEQPVQYMAVEHA